MPTIADLHRAVQAAIQSKRIGKPVFVRYLFQNADDTKTVVPRLTFATGAIRSWLGQTLDRVYALNSAAGEVSLTLQFKEGGAALVSFARGQPRGAGVELMVLGNHGALYHDSGTAQPWDEAAAWPEDRPDPDLLGIIERALQSGEPERIGKEAKP